MKTDYTNLEVDTGDIWKYEFNEFKVAQKPLLYEKLIEVTEPIISTYTKPFLKGKNRTDGWAMKYYRNYPERYKSRNIDYFEFDGDYFAYDELYTVKLSDINLKDFSFLFALKLRQYQDNLAALDSFLYYQLKANFKGNVKVFMNFLNSILIQYAEILGSIFEKKINLWETNYHPAGVIDINEEWFWENDESWDIVELYITNDQVRAFFSFLYLERNDKGQPYLEKPDVEKLFRFGFKIPPVPLTRKFKLNLTSKSRKSIFEQCVYTFYNKYAGSQKNKVAFLKFLAYTFEEFKHIQSADDFRNWSKNFTQKKFRTPLPFDIKRYFDKVKSS